MGHDPIYLDGNVVPYSDSAKYLGLTLDAKLRWKVHVKKKRSELNLKFRKMYWLLGRKSKLSIYNKALLYKQILRPVWAYGIQLWGCTAKSNLKIIQTFQNKVLRAIVNAPMYTRNSDIHRDLNIETVQEVALRLASSYEMRIDNHPNATVDHLFDRGVLRRLKRTKTFELSSGNFLFR